MSQINNRKDFQKLFFDTNRLVLYRNILKDELINKVRSIIWLGSRVEIKMEELETLYYDILNELIEAGEDKIYDGDIWKNYLLWKIATDKNVFSKASEYNRIDNIDKDIYKAALHDLKILKILFDFELNFISDIIGQNSEIFPADFKINNYFNKTSTIFYNEYKSLFNSFQEDIDVKDLAEKLSNFYYSVGSGSSGLYIAFRWDNSRGLVGIKHPDPVTFKDLIGYEKQKKMLIENTESFIKGKSSNNILLYGERGTGKSSSIKALLNKYSSQRLKLVEVAKYQLNYFPQILQDIRQRAQKFIIFIDDLSFESDETEYKYLKAFIEGGVEVKPENAVIYATSNRKHLIQEKWSDRVKDDEEIHANDSIEEKLSLSDRFGITITYTSPNQEQYLKIVEELAEKSNIKMPLKELHKKALLWEKWHNTRSGRTARQFINYLLGA
jgi:hypothetical protein